LRNLVYIYMIYLNCGIRYLTGWIRDLINNNSSLSTII
jgi:hypothetical protein